MILFIFLTLYFIIYKVLQTYKKSFLLHLVSSSFQKTVVKNIQIKKGLINIKKP
jgi:hypothetical protein